MSRGQSQHGGYSRRYSPVFPKDKDLRNLLDKIATAAEINKVHLITEVRLLVDQLGEALVQ